MSGLCLVILVTRLCRAAGILGENLVLPYHIVRSEHSFWVINAVAFSLCLVCFMGLMLYIRWRRLM